MDRWQSGMVVGLLLAGCSNFVAADNAGPQPMGSGTTNAESSTSGSTSTAGATGSAEGTGSGGSTGGAATTGDAASTDTSASGSTAADALDGSTGSPGAETFPFEGDYSGSFDTACAGIGGVLSVAIDGVGVISGTAMAAGQTAAITGSIDAVGSLMGDATLPGVGACNLSGDIDPDNLVGDGIVNCPTVPCSGTWILAG